MTKSLALTLVLAALCPALWAQHQPKPQQKFQIYGQVVEDRASTRIGYWRTGVNAGIGETVLSYGRPVWKPAYDQQLDAMTSGKMWRMGDNYWSLLDTTLPVRIGGREVAPGLYFLAVRRSADGALWELVFIDHDKARARGLDAYDVGTRPDEIPILFAVPLSFEKTEEKAERLTVLFKLDADSKTDGTLRLTWGNFALTAPVSVQLPEIN